MHIVDRRLNPSGKNLANRQRFMRRAKSLIRKAVHESSASRSIKDADQAGEVELPALAKRRVVDSESVSWHRAGYSVTGSPANLALLRTVRNSLSRRIALKRPKPADLQELRDQIAALSPDGE